MQEDQGTDEEEEEGGTCVSRTALWVSSALLGRHPPPSSFAHTAPPAPVHTPLSSFPDNEGDSPRSPSEPRKELRSPAEQRNKGLRGTSASPLGESPDPPSVDAESSGEQLLEEESPGSPLFELEIEALPEDATPSSPVERDISFSRKQSEDSLPPILENGAGVVTSTSFNGRVSSHTWQDSSPPCKRSRKYKKQLGSGPLEDR